MKIHKLTQYTVIAGLFYGGVLFGVEPPKNMVSMEKAKTTALKKYPGTVKSSELEEEQGKWVYSFDIVGTDQSIHEVWVDAKNGRLVKHKLESASEEANEQKVEREGGS